MARIAASRKARQRRACLVASGLVSALVLYVAGSGWALTGYVSHTVNSGPTAAAPGAPLNILLTGVGRRNGLTARQQARLHFGRVQGTAGPDAMMLVHISPAHGRVTVVSLPGDSWVDIPGHGMSQINAADGLGGPGLLVRTVEQATGLTVNDYAEVSLLAFGSVNACLTEPVRGPASGIRMTHLMSAMLPALRVDKGLNVPALAGELRGIAARDVAFLAVPIAKRAYQAPDGESAVRWNARQASRLFGAIRADQPVIRTAAPVHRTRRHPGKPGGWTPPAARVACH